MRMAWLRSMTVWLVIMLVESIHGTLRTLFFEPWLGSFRARQIGVFTGCILIGTLTFIFIRWIGMNSATSLFALGAVWVALTLLFEFVIVGAGIGLLVGTRYGRL
jgi:hypothetical protein